jgi:hypothetical protein
MFYFPHEDFFKIQSLKNRSTPGDGIRPQNVKSKI